MTDQPLPMTDMGPFMRRHDARTRRTLILLVSVSLLIAAVVIAWGAGDRGSLGALPFRLWLGMLFPLLGISMLWLGAAVMRRRRPVFPDGSLPMNPDEARSAERVADAGAVYFAGIGVVAIATQLVAALKFAQALPSLDVGGGTLFSRAIVLAVGVLVAYFGNAWPRFPPPRRPGQDPAKLRKFNRYLGWILVVHGLLLALTGLFLGERAVLSIVASTLAASMVLCMVVCKVVCRFSARTPSAA